MTRLHTSFVLGYHGCERDLAFDLVARRKPMLPSDKPYDWVGPGVYFWESDPQRAWEWAENRYPENPGVVGAVIDLGQCLDLLHRESQDLLSEAYHELVDVYREAGIPLPENRNSPRGGDQDRLLRELDCAVIRFLHDILESIPEEAGDDGSLIVAPFRFDTVRGMFTEGEAIYPGSGFFQKSHVQIAVRNPECIKGLFLPPELDEFQRPHHSLEGQAPRSA